MSAVGGVLRIANLRSVYRGGRSFAGFSAGSWQVLGSTCRAGRVRRSANLPPKIHAQIHHKWCQNGIKINKNGARGASGGLWGASRLQELVLGLSGDPVFHIFLEFRGFRSPFGTPPDSDEGPKITHFVIEST